MATRYNINDFALANPAYAGGTVSFYTVSGGAKTTTLATLYAASTGSTTLANPRTLDSDGKFSVPVYVEVATVATVSGLTVADHDTGIMGLAESAAAASAAAAAVSAAAALVSQLAAAASAAAVLGQFAASAGASLIGWIQAGAAAVARTVQAKLRDQVSVKDFGATGDGVTNDAAAIQAALSSGAGHVHFPDGNYLVSTDITLPTTSCRISFSNLAIIEAGANNVNIFKSTVSAYNVVIESPHISGNAKTGVTAFDLVQFTSGSAINNAYIYDVDTGIYLRSLCGSATIHSPAFIRVPHPIKIKDGSNCTSIINPQISLDGSGSNGGANSAGIECVYQLGDNPVTSLQVIGGYVQNFKYGVLDTAAWGTHILGTYFELNTTADVMLDNSVCPIVDGTMHLAASLGGDVCVKGDTTLGARILNVCMGSGGRAGLLDFDTTNVGARFDFLNSGAASLNIPLGTVTGITPINTGMFDGSAAIALTFATPGDLAIAYAAKTFTYVRHGNLITYSLELVTSAFTHTTAAGTLRLTGLPFDATAHYHMGECGVSGYTKAGYTKISSYTVPGGSELNFQATGSGVAAATLAAADLPTGGIVTIYASGSYMVP